MRQGRRVRRVIRRVEPWSVLRLSILFYLSVVAILLVAGVFLWVLADLVGVIDNVETFIQDIGFDEFRFLPMRILRGSILGGAVLVLVGTGFNVLLTVLFNLISDVVGGIEVTVLEEVPVPAAAATPAEAADTLARAPDATAPMPTPAPTAEPGATAKEPAADTPVRPPLPSGIFEPSGETAERSLGL